MGYIDPLKDGKSRIELIDSMGNDLSIVNDARASFEKTSSQLQDQDIKLIKYLITHNHTSPFRGVIFKFKVKAPLYICRQWWKHVIASNHNDEQLGWNEKSFRYVAIDDSNEFYIPTIFRQQAKNNKQATSGSLEESQNNLAIAIYQQQCEASYEAYSKLLALGVGREQARGVLIPSVYTSWVWTASLQSLLHFIDLRAGEGAQSEIGAYAQAIIDLVSPIVPEAIQAWSSLK
ncbi:MAG: FAD-dependent thymidylate synthase [Cyanobacteria bacterium]|nr:FAD-dependent thymidylate synthase [Cyanobacteria bacterium CG_2015-16_32_12]NCO79521.1 FAD-dependent thymidylate synthase [Cyanobacteria bacterium CG_2015-22_32_23]NCQ04558.1 FAD-dependent thymidylate synthase [Cyanobacteria bacterium CG_2015-09_32_10]NCQ43269.1 FAD-dependent thymidylate synthase [Cyanobacteria bacterium CG_2015-04_32_10]NCS84561.1 FAD-dependent thymidylate synthase [Cyanobacteria bacterium CG_2015-02_32_10]